VRHRGYLLVGVAILCIALFFLPSSVKHGLRANANEGVAPYEGLFANAAERVRQSGRLFWGPQKSLSEREKIEDELSRLRLDAERVRELERENAELRALLEFTRTSSRRFVLCDVIARNDISGWWQTIHLNRGTADGVTVDRAVITPEGLIGKTVEVSRHTARVLLITDPSCKVASRFAAHPAFGVLRGGGATLGGESSLEMLCAPDPCHMDFVNRDTPLTRGDEVLTSGLGGVFPEGLKIGYVQKTYLDRSGLYQHADVVPAAKLSALTRVFVVTE
jgi:rod shape-determining protein MreC